ncbi:MAG: YtxH domain-containing protein [Bacteroidota bacterium]
MSNKFIAGVLLGAVAGTALVLFLNSEKGKELIKDLKDGAEKIKDDLGDLADDVVQKGRSFMDETEQAS